MKKLLIIIALLIPMVAMAFGPKPANNSITFPDSTKIYSNDTLSATLVGANRVKIDSAGTITTSGTASVSNWTAQEPVFRDSALSASLNALDTIDVVMGTGLYFNHVKGFYRFGFVPDSTIDSVKIQYRIVHGTYPLTRWLPMAVDTQRTAGSAPAYASSMGNNIYAVSVPYWGLLYDPSTTAPMGCIPKSQDQIEFRFIQTKTVTSEVKFTTFIVWQEN